MTCDPKGCGESNHCVRVRIPPGVLKHNMTHIGDYQQEIYFCKPDFDFIWFDDESDDNEDTEDGFIEPAPSSVDEMPVETRNKSPPERV